MVEKKQGFEMSIDDARNILKIRAWGFWDAEIAGKYRYECSHNARLLRRQTEIWLIW
jgi:hypothetical protein